MQLINTEGMAFIGPGSEWFWTALTGLVLAVTFVGIYRQLSITRSASAREQLASFSREWTSERMLLHRLEVLVALRDGTDPAHLPAGSPDWIGAFWEDMGSLTRLGHLDPKLVWESGPGPRSEAWWKTLAPYVRRVRAEEGESDVLRELRVVRGDQCGVQPASRLAARRRRVDRPWSRGPDQDDAELAAGRTRASDRHRRVARRRASGTTGTTHGPCGGPGLAVPARLGRLRNHLLMTLEKFPPPRGRMTDPRPGRLAEPSRPDAAYPRPASHAISPSMVASAGKCPASWTSTVAPGMCAASQSPWVAGTSVSDRP